MARPSLIVASGRRHRHRTGTSAPAPPAASGDAGVALAGGTPGAAVGVHDGSPLPEAGAAPSSHAVDAGSTCQWPSVFAAGGMEAEERREGKGRSVTAGGPARASSDTTVGCSYDVREVGAGPSAVAKESPRPLPSNDTGSKASSAKGYPVGGGGAIVIGGGEAAAEADVDRAAGPADAAASIDAGTTAADTAARPFA